MSTVSVFVLGKGHIRQIYHSFEALEPDCPPEFHRESIKYVVANMAASTSHGRQPVELDIEREQPNQDGQTKAAVMSKILIVVDDVESCETFAKILQEAGHSVRLLRSSAELFRILLLFEPDIVLFDMNSPNISNMLTLSIVWRMSELTRTKIIVSTECAQIGATQHINWRADSILAKPISSEKLLATVASFNPANHDKER